MKKVIQISVPLMYGANEPGIEKGISMIKPYISKDGLIEIEISGDINNNHKMKNLDVVINTSKRLAETMNVVLKNGDFPLVIGGDHSVSLGSVSASANHFNNIGLVWIDAHGDMNTADTSPSGNIHGMVLAALQGLGDSRIQNILSSGIKVKTENIVIIGVRDLDLDEKKLMEKVNVKYITYKEIDNKGLNNIVNDVIAYLKGKVEYIHISLDLDSIDPVISPGVSVPVREGFNKDDIRFINDVLFNSFSVVSYDIVEYNPLYDYKDKTKSILLEQILYVKNKVKVLNNK